MIKFFRHIRKSLLEENKMGKYFKYAIGEIILVVIGILIALQINNWNENKKERAFENKMLQEIRKELIQDTIYFGMIKKRAKRTIEAVDKMLIYYAQKVKVTDSVSKYARNIFTSFQFSYHKGAYEAIKSTGIDKISNDSIRNTLTDLYDFSIPRNEALIQTNLSSTEKSWIKDISVMTIFSVTLDDNNNPVTQIELDPDYYNKNKKLQLILDRKASYTGAKLRIENLQENYSKLLLLLDKELGIVDGLKTDPKNAWK